MISTRELHGLDPVFDFPDSFGSTHLSEGIAGLYTLRNLNSRAGSTGGSVYIFAEWVNSPGSQSHVSQCCSITKGLHQAHEAAICRSADWDLHVIRSKIFSHAGFYSHAC